MAYHTSPASLPGNWFASHKLPSADGLYERWIVIHPSNSNYHPYAVHQACYYDEGVSKGNFAYERGDYCQTLEEAQKKFEARIKS
jgi:hypothetical protein